MIYRGPADEAQGQDRRCNWSRSRHRPRHRRGLRQRRRRRRRQRHQTRCQNGRGRKHIRNLGRRALTIQGDVSRRGDLERLFDEAWQQLGPIDILVNNAGIETIVPFTELTDQQWDDVVHVNLKGGWMAAQIFCKRLIAEGRKGSIVNIGSIQAGRVLPGRTHYAPSKLAIEALTRNMSAEVGPTASASTAFIPG